MMDSSDGPREWEKTVSSKKGAGESKHAHNEIIH